jgi:plastocyanin
MDDDKQPISGNYEPLVVGSQSPNKISSKKLFRNKRLLILCFLVIVFAMGLVAYTIYKKDSNSGVSLITEAPTQVEISITSTAVIPAIISVSTGSQVTWINNDSAQHQIIAETVDGFDNSILLEPEESYSFIFETPGTYLYHDQFNPQQIQGTIEVK